jgi:hypothetical protein
MNHILDNVLHDLNLKSKHYVPPKMNHIVILQYSDIIICIAYQTWIIFAGDI